jgi:hypothetical protein
MSSTAGGVGGGTTGDDGPESDVGGSEAALPADRPSEGAPTRDDLFEALDNRRRRYMIHYLQRREGDDPVDVSEVSAQVAAWELDADPELIGYDDRKNVHTALYQFHAPKLDDLGLVEYDKRSGTVALTGAGAGLRVAVAARDDEADDGGVVSLLGVAGAGAVALGTGLLVSNVAVAVTLVAATAMAAGYLVGARRSTGETPSTGVVVEHPPPPVPED